MEFRDARDEVPAGTTACAAGLGATTDPVTIKVVCRDTADQEILRLIRHWGHQLADSSCRYAIGAVVQLGSGDGLGLPQAGPLVVVAPGRLEQSVRSALMGTDDVETIFHIPLTHSRLPYPSACHLESSATVVSAHVIEALRKAIIRLRTKPWVTVRHLQTPQDLGAYFSLRYAVWRDLNYIPPRRLSMQTEWEVDYSDRLAIAIGAFISDTMVGCARLVMPLGAETPTVDVIRSLLAARADRVLTANFDYPRTLTHPFDMLQSFPAFQAYYHDLVVRRVRKAEVSRVIVCPQHRHRGLGELLVDSLVSIAKRTQIRRLFLACSETNAPLYQRSAFTILPHMRTDHFVNVNAPAIAMERDLGETP